MAVVSPRPLPDRPTVIVLRALPGLGDWLCAVPTLRAIKAARPNARIHLVALASTRPLIGRFTGLVDGFHVFPGWPGLPEQRVDAAAIPGFLAALQSLDADLAIQLHGSGETTNEFVQLFGARHVAGFYRAGARCPDPSRFLTWRDEDPEVRRGLRLLSLLGITDGNEELTFPLDPAGAVDARLLLAEVGVTEPFVVVHPGGSRPAARWRWDGFARVGGEMAALGRQVVVTGTREEASLTSAVAAAIPGAVDLGGRTSLDSLGWILRQATLVVANDTGVAHLADALDVPSVVVFAADDGSRAARWAPLDTRLHQAVGGSPGAVSARARRLLRQIERGAGSRTRHPGVMA